MRLFHQYQRVRLISESAVIPSVARARRKLSARAARWVAARAGVEPRAENWTDTVARSGSTLCCALPAVRTSGVRVVSDCARRRECGETMNARAARQEKVRIGDSREGGPMMWTSSSLEFAQRRGNGLGA